MTRETKHGPRVDEQLKKETGSLSGEGIEGREEYHRTEGPTDEDFLDAKGSTPGGKPPEAQLELRTFIAQFLRPSVFPAGRDDLVDTAEENHAPNEIVQTLRRLPDREFENVQAVWEALGGEVEDRN